MSAVSGNPTMTSPSVEKLVGGTHVTIGKHVVEIIDYMAEGGFAQIYKVKFINYISSTTTTTPPPLHVENDVTRKSPDLNEQGSVINDIPQGAILRPGELACLKRVIVQDPNGLNELRNEVNVMHKLKDASNIVQLYDSNAQRYTKYSTQGFEVLLLMELCPNKSLLDYMNQRLSTKLSEQEILKIMFDITMAIAQMHYLAVPLIHRDIKIENVLVDKDNNFKLCDFGSTSTTFPIVTTHRDIAMLSQNIYVHTTPQYRSPEMIDLYRCVPIDEKSDIWALGIFLYKLLFFTTPFERTGQFAILHSKFEIPMNNFSSRLINLIIIMLSENPNLRPNIYQVMCQLCSITKTPLPLADKYSMGPYDFDQYMLYQNNLQTLQLQLFNMQTKRTNQRGFLSQDDNLLLNQIYMATYNVSPTIIIPQTNVLNNIDNNNNSALTVPQPTKEMDDVNNERHTPNLQEQKEHDTLFSPEQEQGQDNPQQLHEQKVDTSQYLEQDFVLNENIADDTVVSPTSEHYYPTIGEINDYVDKKHEQQQQQQQQLLNKNNLQVETPIVPSAALKQHKSNNPFPRINYGTDEIVNRFPTQKQQTYPVNINIQTNHQAGVSTVPQNVPINSPYSTQQMISPPKRAVASPISPQQMLASPPSQQLLPQQSPRIPGVALVQQPQYTPDGNMTESLNTQAFSQTKLQAIDPSMFPSVQLNNNTQQTVSSESSSLPSSSSPSMLPPPVPPHPLNKATKNSPKISIANDNYSKEGSPSLSPPEIPPHPITHLEESLIDLSSPEKKHPVSHDTFREKLSDHPTGIDRNSSNKSDVQKKKLLNPPTTESIEFDLEGAKRKSLDLKLQRLALDLDESQETKRTSMLDKLKFHGSLKDEVSTRDDISISEAKKSFDQDRVSLNLERISDEALRDQKKKHRLFSRLRNDKKN